VKWAKVAVMLGSLLLVVGFCLGTDTPGSTTVAGQSYACADVIPASLLVPGQPTEGHVFRTPAERLLDARRRAGCAPVERAARWAVWAGLGLGALVLLTGWTTLREREHDALVARRTEVPTGV
jgi:hypothetical protein